MGGSISQEEAPTVAIVGGGMAGLNLAMTLDASKKFNTVVIERYRLILAACHALFIICD